LVTPGRAPVDRVRLQELDHRRRGHRVFFKERFGAPRIAAAGLLVVGIGLMLHAG